MKSKCETCDGKKFIIGFGGIRKPCTACGLDVKLTPKKMGRPKQNK